MKTFKNKAAQGDLLIDRIETLPDGMVEVRPDNNKLVLAHSETGHHHTVPSSIGILYRDPNNQFVAYIRVTQPGLLTHERSFDQHEPITIGEGIYKITNQREYSPEGWRRAAD